MVREGIDGVSNEFALYATLHALLLDVHDFIMATPSLRIGTIGWKTSLSLQTTTFNELPK